MAIPDRSLLLGPTLTGDHSATTLTAQLADSVSTIVRAPVKQSGPTYVHLAQLSSDSGPTIACRGGPPPLDDRMIWILDAPPNPGEAPIVHFARKERDLGNAFADLTADQAGHLHARLTLRFGNDLVATKFARLSEERRTRLLTFLRLCAERG